MKNFKIVVYTVNLNNYDEIIEAPETSNVEFVLFTDNPKPVKNWRIIPFTAGNRRASRYLKINSHLLFQYLGYQPEITVYIDANIRLNRDWANKIDWDSIKSINVAKHKDHIDEHFNKIINLNKNSKSLIEDLQTQRNKYYNEGMPKDNPVTENCFIIRKSNRYSTGFNNAWWSEYSLASERDQISFSYITWKSHYSINYFPWDARNNDIYNNWGQHKYIKRINSQNNTTNNINNNKRKPISFFGSIRNNSKVNFISPTKIEFLKKK